MKKIIYLICGLIINLSIIGEVISSDKEYKWTIKDESGNVLEGVEVSNSEGKVISYSNEKGVVFFNIENNSKLYFTKRGYQISVVQVESKETMISLKIDMNDPDLILRPKEMVPVPFGSISKDRIVGAATVINVDEELRLDQRTGINSAINGKLPGVFFNQNIRGFGQGIYVIDGIPREIDFYNLTEIESITVLRDPVSRMLYGAQADQGVFLITTKRGKVGKKEIRVRAEHGMQTPLRMPEYLNAADYMVKFNESAQNDGLAPRFSQDQIDQTRSGSDRVLYPDEDFFDSRFLKDQISYTSINADVSGGNENANYFVNVGGHFAENWINMNNLGSERFNVRANTQFKISDIIKMQTDVVTAINFDRNPNTDFWSLGNSTFPNAYPVFIPADRLNQTELLSEAQLVNGNLLGGNNQFQQNLYGEISRKGIRTSFDRLIQFNSKIDLDLTSYIPGLTASGAITFDFVNKFVETQNATYAVYEPFLSNNELTVNMIGQDVRSTQKSAIANESYFQRRVGLYGTIDYNGSFGKSDLSITNVLYADRLIILDELQQRKNLHYGIRANYMFDNKYVAEFSGVLQGSQRLLKGQRFTFSPSVGLGWIVTNEDFFSSKKVNYLKFKSSFGLLKNDLWDQYFLQETYFERAGNFNYNDGGGQNSFLEYRNVAADIGWQKRAEFNIGIEGRLFGEGLNIEANYFYSNSFDNVTALNNTMPSLTGYTVFGNFNSDVTSGVDIGINYNRSVGQWRILVGSNIVLAKNRINDIDEPVFVNAPYRQRSGVSNWKRFGYQADGLYGEADFNEDGSLIGGLPLSTFGAVQPGDIKYLDLNGDGVIDQDDQSIIGNSFPTSQYSLKLNIGFKRFDFYMLGIGTTGNDSFRNSPYFWISGNMKYSAMVNNAYGPGNLDTNAIMPRMSFVNNSNNYRNSSYWLYRDSGFNIPIMQLSYTIESTSNIYNNLMFFVKGNNLVRIRDNKEWSEVNVNGVPQAKGFSVGLVATF